MQVQLQSATAKLPQRHHAGIMEIPGIVGDIGISLVQYPEFVWVEAGFSLYAAQPATIPARGKAAEDRTWYLTNKFIWFYVILDAKLTWFDLVSCRVWWRLVWPLPFQRTRKHEPTWMPNIWACQRSLEMNNMICPYLPPSGTFILFTPRLPSCFVRTPTLVSLLSPTLPQSEWSFGILWFILIYDFA